jgi:hypothetical protein
MVLLLIATAWWGYRQFYPADAGPSASNGVTNAGAVGPVIPAASLPPALKLAALEPVEDKPAATAIRFASANRRHRLRRRRGRRAGAAAPAACQPGPPPPPPGPPPIPLKFVGLMQLPNGQKRAALSDGRATLSGGEGDVIDGRYRIVKIGIESIVMEYVDGKGRQTIPLRGTEP